MGETRNRPSEFSFSSSLKVDFQGSRVTSDAGVLLVRELDERVGLSQLIVENLTDARHEKNTQLPLCDLLRQSVCSRLAGYEDLNDAERLSQDPTFRLIGSEKIRECGDAAVDRDAAASGKLMAGGREHKSNRSQPSGGRSVGKIDGNCALPRMGVEESTESLGVSSRFSSAQGSSAPQKQLPEVKSQANQG